MNQEQKHRQKRPLTRNGGDYKTAWCRIEAATRDRHKAEAAALGLSIYDYTALLLERAEPQLPH